jgi:hypothetical protein
MAWVMERPFSHIHNGAQYLTLCHGSKTTRDVGIEIVLTAIHGLIFCIITFLHYLTAIHHSVVHIRG